MSTSNKNQYTLRDGYPYVQGDELTIGPEILFLSLDQAYGIKHVLEEDRQIRDEWRSKNKAKLLAHRVQKRVERYIKAGVEPEQALEKAQAAVMKQEELRKLRRGKAAADAAVEPAAASG